VSTITTETEEMLHQIYRDGLADGMEITLKLLLGRPTNGGTPCPQPLSVAIEDWALRALHNIKVVRDGG